MRLFIVDDSAVACAMVRRLLDAAGDVAVIGEAPSAEDALDPIAELAPDLVVMDWAMPGMSGVEATAELRRRHPNLHIVGFTSTREAAIHDAFLSAGASAVFAKDDALALRDYVLSVAVG